MVLAAWGIENDYAPNYGPCLESASQYRRHCRGGATNLWLFLLGDLTLAFSCVALRVETIATAGTHM